MKSITGSLALIFVGCLPLVSNGQSSRLSIGPSASIDHYWGAGHNTIEWHKVENRTKYSAGVGAYYNLTDRFVLKSGLMYSRKGYKSTNDPEKADNLAEITYREKEYKANHIDLPLLVGYRVATAGRWSLVPAAGIIGSFKVTETINITHLDESTQRQTLSPSLSRAALGFTVEAGINYQATETMQLGFSPYLRSMSFGFDPGPDYYGALLELRFRL